MGTMRAVRWEEMLSALIVATAVVAAVELVLLRIVTRTFVHIPGVAVDGGPLAVLADAGRLAYYTSGVLVVALLAAVWFSQVRAGKSLAAAAIALFVVASVGARIGWLDPASLPAAVVLAVVLLAGGAIRGIRAPRPTLIALTGAVVVYGMWAIGSQLTSAGVVLPEGSTALLLVGEVLVVIGFTTLPLSISLPRGTRRFDRATILVAGATGLAVFAGLQFAESTFKILLLWNLGLAGYLPALAYALAAAGAATGIAIAVRAGQTHLAAAIVLFLAGGFAFTSTYQSGLVIAALGILAIVPAAEDSESSPTGPSVVTTLTIRPSHHRHPRSDS